MPVDDGIWPPEPDATQDPAVAGVTEPVHYGPPSLTEPEGLVLEPHRDGDEEVNPPQGAVPEKKPEVPTFDPRVREPFEGMLFLGRLTSQFEYVGHQFEIRTLTTDEVLEIGLLTKPYNGTLGELKAYQAATVASCVVKVDGKALPTPITNDTYDTPAKNRFDYVKRSWFPPVLDYVYEQYLLLEAQVQEILSAMGKASR